MAFPRVFALSPAVLAMGFLAGYVLLDWISFIQPFAAFGITPWNPPAGLSFILVLLFGQQFIPLLFVAPLLADLLVRHLPFPWWVEIAGCLINGGGYAIGLLVLLRPATRFNPALASMRDLLVLIAIAALSGAFVAAGYVGLLVVSGLLAQADFVAAALQFWIGDIIGIAVVAPFALIFMTRGRGFRLKREIAAQIAAIVLAIAVVFFYGESHRFELFYILFLPVVWMAVRGGLELVTVGILLTQIGLVISAQVVREGIDVTAFQALMLVLAMTGLAAGAIVTEHRQTELQLRLHQESLARIARLGSMGEFAAMIAHEINQPLTAAGTYTRLVADTLRAPGPPDQSAAETAEKAAAQVARAAEVVRRLRALIRLDQSGRAPTTVERIVRESLDLCRPEIDRYGIAIRLSIDGDLPPLMVDLLQIEQVLVNLLRNAAQAIAETGQPGTVTLSAATFGTERIKLEIRDTGPGFPPDFVSDIPLLASHKTEGLGVGLSLCRSIVEAHGGKLVIGGGDVGAVVTITLPVAKVS